jgi:hypothetical protein
MGHIVCFTYLGRRGSKRGDKSIYFPSPFNILAHDGVFLLGPCQGIPYEFLSSGNSSRVISLAGSLRFPSVVSRATRIAVLRRSPSHPANLDTIRMLPIVQKRREKSHFPLFINSLYIASLFYLFSVPANPTDKRVSKSKYEVYTIH